MATQKEAETTKVQDDPKAREILRRAYEKSLKWGSEFKGFTADVIFYRGKERISGTLKGISSRDVEVYIADETIGKWIKDQVASIIGHRMSINFEEADGKYALTLGDEDYAYGRLIHIHGDGYNSTYRVKDDVIRQINRTMGQHIKFTINIEEYTFTKDHRVLPKHYVVYYFSPESGELRGVESYTETFIQVGEFYLPEVRRVTSAKEDEVVTKTILFKNHKLL